MNLKDRNSLLYVLPIVLLNMVVIGIVIAILLCNNINVKGFILIALICVFFSALINGIREFMTKGKKIRLFYYLIIAFLVLISLTIII